MFSLSPSGDSQISMNQHRNALHTYIFCAIQFKFDGGSTHVVQHMILQVERLYLKNFDILKVISIFVFLRKSFLLMFNVLSDSVCNLSMVALDFCNINPPTPTFTPHNYNQHVKLTMNNPFICFLYTFLFEIIISKTYTCKNHKTLPVYFVEQ